MAYFFTQHGGEVDAEVPEGATGDPADNVVFDLTRCPTFVTFSRVGAAANEDITVEVQPAGFDGLRNFSATKPVGPSPTMLILRRVRVSSWKVVIESWIQQR